MARSTIRLMATQAPILTVPPIRLTELTTCGGCAAKLGADALEEALAGLGIEDGHDAPSDLIAGLNPPDDAAVHLVAPGVAVIGTLDFFPPIVDDPRTFGEIAAANALSGRVRDGRSGPVRPVGRGHPGGLPGRRVPGDPRGRIVEGSRGRRHPRRRSHDPRPRAEVRPGRHRRRLAGSPAAEGRRPAGRPPDPDQGVGHRACSSAGTGRARRRRRISTRRWYR